MLNSELRSHHHCPSRQMTHRAETRFLHLLRSFASFADSPQFRFSSFNSDQFHCSSLGGLGAAPFLFPLRDPVKGNPCGTISVPSKDMTNPLPSPSHTCDADILLLCQLEEVCVGNFSGPEDASIFSEAGGMEGLQILKISHLQHSEP